MTECKLVNFDVTIQGEQPPFYVLAAYQGHTATGAFDQTITQESWQIAQRALERSAYLPDAAGIMAAGSRLYHALMRGPVRDLWISARADLEHERVSGLRLRLALYPPAVAGLPW
jgi:L-amino acid N-acyltransferase YncA